MAHILVIDDEFGLAEVLEAFLTDLGHEVTTAINGRQGLERIREKLPDLIFLDMMMPVMDGAAVLRALAAEPSFAAIPVVVMSSLPEPTVVTLASGYRAFLRKPFRLRAVVAAIESTLGLTG